MIDHILIQIEKTDLVSMCKVLDDDALNVSTHRPIVMHFELPHVEQIGSKASLRHRVKLRGVSRDMLVYSYFMLQQAIVQNISPRCRYRLGRLLPEAKPRAIACQVGICTEGKMFCTIACLSLK